MKHIKIISKLAMVVAGSFMLSSFSPSLDGRAVVVDEGVMPSGLFAKTVGYLPGDVISVSNAGGNGTVDLLVIGALDASEGVAIMLTPEAAKAVGIEKDSNSIVKITKRNGQDDRVYGNAVISSDSSSSKAQKAPAVDNPSADSVSEEVFLEETPVQDIAVSPAETVAEAAAGLNGTDMLADSDAEDVEDIAQAGVTENLENDEDDVIAEPLPVIEKAEDTSSALARADERKQNTTVEEVAVIAEEADDADLERIEESPFEEITEELPDEVETAESPAYFAETNPVQNIEEAPLQQNEANALAYAVDVTDAESAESAASNHEEQNDDYDSYEAIVLVPAAANPPASDSPYSSDFGDASNAGVAQNENVGGAEIAKTAASSAQGSAPVPARKAYADYQSLVVSDEKDLIRNSYYVQIATMRDDANIMEVVNKYGNNYPITIVQLANNSKQILIGSLSIDEYAVVLERFKSYGYKDAFLRKIR